MELQDIFNEQGVIKRDVLDAFVVENGLVPSECIDFEKKYSVEKPDYSLDSGSLIAEKNRKGDINSFELYKKEISKIPFLTADEERNLSCIINTNRPQKGEEPNLAFITARNKLVEHNLAFALWYAKKFFNMTAGALGIEDLVQECNLGLVYAAEHYDASKGIRFTTYAYWSLLIYVKKAISDRGFSMKLPIFYPERYDRIQKIIGELSEELNFVRQPTIEEIVARYNHLRPNASTKITVGIAQEILDLFPNASSLEDYKTADTDGRTETVKDFIADGKPSVFEQVEKWDFRNVSEELMDKVLTPQEKRAFVTRYGKMYDRQEPFSYVGQKLGVTPQRASKLVATATSKLCKALKKIGYGADMMSGRA